MMKRVFDIVISLVAITLFVIPMILICIIIKLDSKGPVLFKQKRIGKEGALFNIYKFRSMAVGAPNVSTEALGDSSHYITRVGKFIRVTSLDELPQLFNILKGDMTMIGPRPALYNQYELIEMRTKVGVNAVRPGLTGYAQVMGRDLISDEEKVAYDHYYVKNSSMKFDIKILWMTVISVIKADGIKN